MNNINLCQHTEIPMYRPSWDQYFMSVAKVAATRATCPRKSVGAVIVKDRQVLTTGYNGSLPNEPHCIEVGCDLQHNHCVRTVHAEVNAILQAAKHGTSVSGATLYVTAKPCPNCTKLAIGAGISRIVYAEEYGSRDEKQYSIPVERLISE
jgi:dCMP deaminase